MLLLDLRLLSLSQHFFVEFIHVMLPSQAKDTQIPFHRAEPGCNGVHCGHPPYEAVQFSGMAERAPDIFDQGERILKMLSTVVNPEKQQAHPLLSDVCAILPRLSARQMADSLQHRFIRLAAGQLAFQWMRWGWLCEALSCDLNGVSGPKPLILDGKRNLLPSQARPRKYELQWHNDRSHQSFFGGQRQNSHTPDR